MKTNILGICLLVALIASGSHAGASVYKPTNRIYSTKSDTTKSGEYSYQADIRKGAISKTNRQEDREKMLERLSKKPSDFPEVFSNAKEEYLWQEKAKVEQAAYEKHIKEINQPATTTAQH